MRIHWLNKLYCAIILMVLAGLLGWLFVGRVFYDPEKIAGLKTLIEGQEEIKGPQESIEWFKKEEAAAQKTIKLIQETNAEEAKAPDLARAVTEIEQAREHIEKIRDDIDEVDKKIGTSYLLSVAILVSGVLLQIIVAGIVAYLVHCLLVRPRLPRWAEQKKGVVEDFDNCLREMAQWPREEICYILVEDPRTQPLKDELEKLMSNRLLEARKKEETKWEDVAKLLIKIGRSCANRREFRLENLVKPQYDRARRIIILDLWTKLSNWVLPLALFLLIFWIYGQLIVSPLMGKDIAREWFGAVGWIAGGLLSAFLILCLLQFVVRWGTEKTWSDLDDILVGVVSWAFAVAILAVMGYLGLVGLPGYFKYYVIRAWELTTTGMAGRIALIVIGGSFLLYVFNRVIIYALKKWTEKTEQKYDDMFVMVMQVFGSFVISAVMVGVVLANLQEPIREATGLENVLLPYSIIVSVFSAIIGYASREAIENFFGGILLQIDKPFEVGERLRLAGGEICDVREVGMRSTRLYSVLEHTELFIPNTLMTSQIITNLSRPDLELRIQIRLQIPHDGYMIRKAEAILLDIAYLEGEVDQIRIERREVPEPLHVRGRRSIREELERLEMTYPKIKEAVVYRIIGGSTVDKENVFPKIYERLRKMLTLREDYKRRHSGELEKVIKAAREARVAVENAEYLDRLVKEVVLRVQECIQEEEEKTEEKRKGSKVIIKEIIDELDQREVEIKGGDLERLLCALSGGEKDLSQAIENIRKEQKKTEQSRYGIIEEILEEFSLVSEYIYAIGDLFPDLRPDMNVLFGELVKEPMVYSHFMVSEEGRPYVELVFNVFAPSLARRFEVSHTLNMAIQQRFKGTGIRVQDIAP